MLSRSNNATGQLWRPMRFEAALSRPADFESAEKARVALAAVDSPVQRLIPISLKDRFLTSKQTHLKMSKAPVADAFQQKPAEAADTAMDEARADAKAETDDDVNALRLRLAGIASVAALILLAALVYTPDIKEAVRIAQTLKRHLEGKSRAGSPPEFVDIGIQGLEPEDFMQSLNYDQGEDSKEKSTGEGEPEEKQKCVKGKGQKEKTNDYSCYQSLGEESGMMIFSGSANVELAREVCAHLNMSLGRMKVTRFADGEVSLDILDDVRSRDVYLFQSVPNASTGIELHGHVMELFLSISALRRASAERITAVLPYMAYSRQEHSDTRNPRPLAVADMSRILHTLGVDRVVFVDLHAPRAAAFFPEPIPVTNLLPQSLAIRYLNKKNLKEPVIVATENTSGERAKLFWSRMKKERPDVGLATVVSNRPDRGRASDGYSGTIQTPSRFHPTIEPAFPSGSCKTYFVGDVEGRDCVIVDDIIDTGVRASNAVRACRAAGARRVFVFASHGLLSRGAIERLDKCGAEEVLLTNSIEVPSNIVSNKLKILNISKLLAEVLKRLHAEVAADFDDKSRLGALYRDPDYDTEQLKTAHSQ